MLIVVSAMRAKESCVCGVENAAGVNKYLFSEIIGAATRKPCQRPLEHPFVKVFGWILQEEPYNPHADDDISEASSFHCTLPYLRYSQCVASQATELLSKNRSTNDDYYLVENHDSDDDAPFLSDLLETERNDFDLSPRHLDVEADDSSILDIARENPLFHYSLSECLSGEAAGSVTSFEYDSLGYKGAKR